MVTDPELDPVSVAGTGDGVLELGLDPEVSVDGVDPLEVPKLDPKSNSVSAAVDVIHPSQEILSPLSLVIWTEIGVVNGNPPLQIQKEGPLSLVQEVLHEELPDDFNLTELTAPYPATSSRWRPYQYLEVPDLDRILIFPV